SSRSPKGVRNWASVPARPQEVPKTTARAKIKRLQNTGRRLQNCARLAILNRHPQTFPKQAIAGHHAVGVGAGNRFAPEFAPGAFEDQPARGNVPKPDTALDVGVKTATGNVGQRQRGGPHHSYFAHAMHELVEVGERPPEAFPALGEPDRNYRFLQAPIRADFYRAPVQARRSAPDSGPHFFTERIINHADHSVVTIRIIG